MLANNYEKIRIVYWENIIAIRSLFVSNRFKLYRIVHTDTNIAVTWPQTVRYDEKQVLKYQIVVMN
jgi:hypothetical protein